MSVICAGNDEELFLRGNKYYAAKDYENALRAYEMIDKKGSAVFYNMANCFFNKEEYAQAIVHWSRAEIGATSDEYQLIKKNKAVAFKKIGKQLTQPRWHEKVIGLLYTALPLGSLLLLQLIFICLWWMFVFISRRQMRAKRIVQLSLSFMLIISATILTMHYTQDACNDALVIKKEVHLFTGPDKSLSIVSSLAYAEKVRVKEMRQGWYKIQYAGMIGWVEADVIQVI